jgi:putative FmdB family regulatory protein
MPIYEYKCNSCGKQFEVRQKFADQPLAIHEECGGPVQRLLSTPALQFKGSGWYVNDYGKSGSGSSSTNGKGDTKSETKAETKSEAAKASSDTKSDSK